MAAPSVYAAINGVSAELAENGIAKRHTNPVDDYKYRSIDDVLDRLAPLFAKHRLCVLPRVLGREVVDRRDEMDRTLFHVALRVAFTLTSVDDGSSHVVEAFGEALDPSDKATAKAMSAAYLCGPGAASSLASGIQNPFSLNTRARCPATVAQSKARAFSRILYPKVWRKLAFVASNRRRSTSAA